MMMDIYIFSLSIFDWATKKGKRHRERERERAREEAIRLACDVVRLKSLGKETYSRCLCVYIYSVEEAERKKGKKMRFYGGI